LVNSLPREFLPSRAASSAPVSALSPASPVRFLNESIVRVKVGVSTRSYLQQLLLQRVVSEQLFFKFLGMQRVGLVDGLSQICLRPVVQLFDLVDLICVEDVFITYLLEEPRKVIKNCHQRL